MADPRAVVLAIVSGADEAESVLSFVNAASGETYEVRAPSAQAIFWLDAHTFGLISRDGKSIYLVNLADGTVEGTPLAATRYRALSGAQPVPAQALALGLMTPLVRIPEAGDDEVTLVAGSASYSSDLSLFAEVSDQEVRVWETETGAPVWESDPEDRADSSEVEFAWSPLDPHELAVVKAVYPEGSSSFETTGLTVVDVVSGEELATFAGGFANTEWSPDAESILYQLPEVRLPGSDEFTGPACVLDLKAERNECFRGIEEHHFSMDGAITFKRLAGFRWNDAGDGFTYVYQASYYPPSPAGGGTQGPAVAVSGLCRFDLADQDVSCATDGVTGLEGMLIESYMFSPDGRYAYISVAGSGEGRLENGHGFLDLTGRRYLTVPMPSVEPGADLLASVLWRPPLQPQISSFVRSTRPTEQDIRDIRSIWDVFNLSDDLDLKDPGTMEFFVEVGSEQTLIWPYYWCATDREVLSENLKSMDVTFLVDEVRVSGRDILEYEHTTEDWACHYWATNLSDWREGSWVLLTIKYSFRRTVDDGQREYRAGDYYYKLNVETRGE